MYQLIVQNLRSLFGWHADQAPERSAIEEFLGANPDETAESVAARLDGYLTDATAGQKPPYGWPGTAKDFLRHDMFTEGVKYWNENTDIALGVITIPVVAQGRIARTVDEWWENQEKGLSYLGYPLLDAGNPASEAEREQRMAAAAQIPFAWLFAGLGLVYQVLTREGLLKKWLKGQMTPPVEHLGGDVTRFYGCNAQQVLDNLLAAQAGRPPKWLEDWRRNPDPGAWE